MKKQICYSLVVSLCIILFEGCASIVPLTDRIIQDVGGESQLENFQYYVSRSIVLSRSERSGSASVEKGKAKLLQKIDRDEVVIKGSTPGVVLFHDDEKVRGGYPLAVAFEKEDKYFLKFMKGSEDIGSFYYLAVRSQNNQTVRYGEDIYYYSIPDQRKWMGFGKVKNMPYPHLLIKLNSKAIEKSKKRTAKGRTLPNK